MFQRQFKPSKTKEVTYETRIEQINEQYILQIHEQYILQIHEQYILQIHEQYILQIHEQYILQSANPCFISFSPEVLRPVSMALRAYPLSVLNISAQW